MIERYNEVLNEVGNKIKSDFPNFLNQFSKPFENMQHSDSKFQEIKNENLNKNHLINDIKSDFPRFFHVEEPKTYNSLADMIRDFGTYKEIKKIKPVNAPNISKWIEKGGSIRIETQGKKEIFVYKDADGREVPYVNGEVKFPSEAKHPVIPDINIGKFTGDRNLDKKKYVEKLKETFGLTEIPEGYALHHDCENGNMQLIKEDYHKEFTHAGGHSKFKEMN